MEHGNFTVTVAMILHCQSVQAAVNAAVARFGGIDILINNASAINLAGILFFYYYFCLFL
jgi:NAD(P)-dependent dehydrogenase (short-subunit alcohol dehydrogenase family)